MSLQFHSKVFLIAGRSIHAHSPEGQDLVDCPTHSTCLYLGFSFVFHAKAKRTQQGNLLVCGQICSMDACKNAQLPPNSNPTPAHLPDVVGDTSAAAEQ